MFELTLIENGCLIGQTDYQMRDLLVALVSMGLGMCILHAVYTENARCHQLGSVRVLEGSLGRTNARIVLYCIGGLCLLMGSYLLYQASFQQRKFWGHLKLYNSQVPHRSIDNR